MLTVHSIYSDAILPSKAKNFEEGKLVLTIFIWTFVVNLPFVQIHCYSDQIDKSGFYFIFVNSGEDVWYLLCSASGSSYLRYLVSEIQKKPLGLG